MVYLKRVWFTLTSPLVMLVVWGIHLWCIWSGGEDAAPVNIFKGLN